VSYASSTNLRAILLHPGNVDILFMHHLLGGDVDTVTSDIPYSTITIEHGKDGVPLPFAMGYCKECGKYVSPCFMMWEGSPCPFCNKPFYPNSQPRVMEEKN